MTLVGEAGSIRSEVQRGINETQRWMIATVIGLFVGFGGLFLAMSNGLKQSPAAPQPIVIYASPPPASAPR